MPANTSLFGEARPFVKWAGGKRQLLPDLLARMPRSYGTYHEPFIGGGALFFAARPERAVLADNNLRLVRTWRGIQYSVGDVIAFLQDYPNSEAFFYELRKKDIDSAASDAEVAAWFIYLNKTAFNGLYRVNSKNRYNVPFGRYDSPNICDAPTLRAVSATLRGVEILHRDFATVQDRAVAGDFVYFDPPYVPLSPSASFTAYTRDGFSLEDQARLRDVALALKEKGVHVLLSNSSAKPVYELYAEGFAHTEIQASRMINSVASKRGAIAELLIW